MNRCKKGKEWIIMAELLTKIAEAIPTGSGCVLAIIDEPECPKSLIK